MKPCTKPKLSRITLTTGTRQFVVQLALEMTWCLAGSYFVWFTPIHDRDVFVLGRARR